jgi:hypothetical protein
LNAGLSRVKKHDSPIRYREAAVVACRDLTGGGQGHHISILRLAIDKVFYLQQDCKINGHYQITLNETGIRIIMDY